MPSDEIDEVGRATVKLKNMESSKGDIENQLQSSIDAFFDLYPEI